MNSKEKNGLSLKRARKAKNLSLRALAELSGGLYSASRLGNYEQGIRTLPADAAVNLAKLLDCTPQELLNIEPGGTSLSVEDLAFIQSYRQLDEGGKKAIGVIMDTLSDRTAKA